MPSDEPRPQRRVGHWVAGPAVASVGGMLSFWLTQQQAASLAQIQQARFVQETRALSDVVALRIAGHTEILNGLRSLFSHNPKLSRLDFERAASDLDVGQRYPGVRQLSFIRFVPAADQFTFESQVRADASLSPTGFPDFGIRPPGQRPFYFVVDYVWPMLGNERWLGVDVAADAANAAALQYSKDSGQTVISAPFALQADASTQGKAAQDIAVALRVPVFDPTADTPERRFLGSVASTVLVQDMVSSAAGQSLLNGVAVTVADVGPVGSAFGAVATARQGEPTAPPPLLFQSSARAMPGVQAHVRELVVHNRRWRLTFHPTRSLLSPSEARLPWLVGLAGGLLSVLLAAMAWILVRQHSAALARASGSESARRTSEERFSAVFNQTSVGVAQLDTQTGRFLRVNQRYGDILGYSTGEMLEATFQSLTHPDDLQFSLVQLERLKCEGVPECRLEKRYLHKNGQEVWVDLTVSPLWAPGAAPGHHLTVVQDITARKQMESSLRANEQRLRSILQRLPMGLCLVQANGQISFRNQRFAQICGYGPNEAPDMPTWWRRAFPDPVARDAVRASWGGADQGAQPADGWVAAQEHTIACGDGTLRPVEMSGLVVDGGLLVTLQDLSQRKAAEDEINTLAYYDPLTRLPNRRLLADRLQQALAASARHQRSGALLMLDLDHFKTINDTRGHDRGDALLVQVAHRLRSCVHEDDTVARLGGDEFVVVLEDLGDDLRDAASRSEEAGQRILALLREPYTLYGESHHSSLSMGITVFTGSAQTVEELLQRADLALYQAKDAGRDTLRFYDPQIQAAVNERAALELDMRVGLAQGQFELYYQPQIDAGRVTGAEALLRWRHPQDGFVSPMRFIPLAEASGLILPLGEWVLQAACKRLAAWAQRPALAALTLAVNVSARQFHQQDFVAQVLAALARSGANGHLLKLEITESLLLEDLEDTIGKMVQLKGYGVGFSLDDFGTGYSSLAYLKRLPLDQLKIDQSFVRDVLTDPNDAAIARTVVALGTSLGLRVIAEGVETEAQRAFLERHQCHAWQGYLLSAPVPVAEFEELVVRTNLGSGRATAAQSLPRVSRPQTQPSSR